MGTRNETVAGIAYHIDKTCTGGTDEDFIAAEAICAEFVDPLHEVLRRIGRVYGPWRLVVAQALGCSPDDLDPRKAKEKP